MKGSTVCMYVCMYVCVRMYVCMYVPDLCTMVGLFFFRLWSRGCTGGGSGIWAESVSPPAAATAAPRPDEGVM